MEPEIPGGMLPNHRTVDPKFDPDEKLYRRFRSEDEDGHTVHIDAIELPDISVMRQKYTQDPVWVLIDITGHHDFSNWGIAAFRVNQVPTQFQMADGLVYRFIVQHVPLKKNYPHSEIRAFVGDKHLSNSASIPPDVHLRFRSKLRQVTKIEHRPTPIS